MNFSIKFVYKLFNINDEAFRASYSLHLLCTVRNQNYRYFQIYDCHSTRNCVHIAHKFVFFLILTMELSKLVHKILYPPLEIRITVIFSFMIAIRWSYKELCTYYLCFKAHIYNYMPHRSLEIKLTVIFRF